MKRPLAIALFSAATLLVSGGLLWAKTQEASAKVQKTAYVRVSEAKTQKQLIDRYCVGCHNSGAKMGGLALEKLDLANVPADAAVWEKVVRKLRGGMMPPAGMPRPDNAQTEAFVGWLEGYLDHAAMEEADPGQVALHRLNRKEYANAVRDLLAVEVDPAGILPQDDTSDGFDNVAEVLRVSPVFMDQYISAARSIAIAAVGDPKLKSTIVNLRPPVGKSQGAHIPGLPLGTRGGLTTTYVFPADGEYDLTFGGAGAGVYSDPVNEDRFIALLDGKVIYDSAKAGESAAPQPAQPLGTRGRGRRTTKRVFLKAGEHTIGAAYVAKSYQASLALLQPLRAPAGIAGPAVTGVEIVGPINPKGLGETPSRKAVFTCRPKSAADEPACAKKILSSIARRAYRRPVTEADMTAPMRFYAEGAKRAGFEAGVQEGLMAILASPKFLYRTTSVPKNLPPGARFEVSDLDLASRLSFFLWSSIPDDELLTLAEKGRLSNPKVLEAQARRMLADPRSESLVTNFAFQWMRMGDLAAFDPDPAIFPEFDADLKVGMREEMRLFLDSVLRGDASVLSLLDADYTFVNERLARHYGVPNVIGNDFRRVKVASARRGILGKGAILAVTSYPNRTAPVLRGAWILENIAGTPPNSPPAGVGALVENAAGKPAKTVREMMAAHRTDPSCAACHTVMDPLGLALENYDAVGAWRKKDRFAAVVIDSSTELPTGEKIEGVDDLRKALLNRPDQFVQTMTERLMTFGLGRALEYHDMPTARAITREAKAKDYRFAALVMGVVKSDQFRMSKTPGEPAAAKVAAR